jgi:hypothetical protein
MGKKEDKRGDGVAGHVKRLRLTMRCATSMRTKEPKIAAKKRSIDTIIRSVAPCLDVADLRKHAAKR